MVRTYGRYTGQSSNGCCLGSWELAGAIDVENVVPIKTTSDKLQRLPGVEGAVVQASASGLNFNP